MPFYEYKVVPAPEKSPRVKGLKGTPRFAHGLQEIMNELAQDGWEYYRAESLPDEERKGLMSARETVTRNVLVFRRELYFEEPAEPETPRFTLSQPTGPRAPARATPDDTESPDSFYATSSAAPAPEAQTPAFRRPLVAERKTTGSDD
jgi:hypothetical protein